MTLPNSRQQAVPTAENEGHLSPFLSPNGLPFLVREQTAKEIR